MVVQMTQKNPNQTTQTCAISNESIFVLTSYFCYFVTVIMIANVRLESIFPASITKVHQTLLDLTAQ